MINAINKVKLDVLILFLLAAAAIASYVVFLSYKPNVTVPFSSVKGASTNYFELPLPKDAESMSYSSTLVSNDMIIKSEKTPEEIQQFYKNVMREKGYEIESEQKSEGFMVREYKSTEKSVTVITKEQDDESYTIAGIEIKAR